MDFQGGGQIDKTGGIVCNVVVPGTGITSIQDNYTYQQKQRELVISLKTN